MTVELKGYPVCNNSIIMATRPRWHCPITSPPNKRASTHSRMRTSTLVYTRPSRPKVYNARHLERIPVVEVDGIVASELVLDRAGVKARLDTVGAWSR